MSDPYVGEIRMFGGNYAPLGWAFCNGALLQIADNATLFNLIGTTYGGDGQQTFAVPDLQGRLPVHQGSGFVIGQKGGVETVSLTTNTIPAHSHNVATTGQPGTSGTPANNILADEGPAGITSPFAYAPNDPANQVQLRNAAPGPTVSFDGGGQPHTNMQPYLTISFIISLFGIYPSPT